MIRILLTLLLPISLLGQSKPPHEFVCGPDEIAFDGNDLVSYYESENILEGKKEFSLKHQGLNLHFASRANLNKFKSTPKKYLPEYGGWCAIALTQGTYARPDFSHYKVQDGKLLFFEVRAFFNGKTAWEKDPEINKIVADRKYKDLRGED